VIKWRVYIYAPFATNCERTVPFSENKYIGALVMQKIFLVSSGSSLEEINDLLREDSDWFVSEMSHPNNKGEWLVVLGDESDDDDEL
jgi:hypothetical protein